MLVGGVVAPCQVGVEAENPDGNAEKLPVALVMLKPKRCHSVTTAVRQPKLVSLHGPPTRYYSP